MQPRFVFTTASLLFTTEHMNRHMYTVKHAVYYAKTVCNRIRLHFCCVSASIKHLDMRTFRGFLAFFKVKEGLKLLKIVQKHNLASFLVLVQAIHAFSLRFWYMAISASRPKYNIIWHMDMK